MPAVFDEEGMRLARSLSLMVQPVSAPIYLPPLTFVARRASETVLVPADIPSPVFTSPMEPLLAPLPEQFIGHDDGPAVPAAAPTRPSVPVSEPYAQPAYAEPAAAAPAPTYTPPAYTPPAYTPPGLAPNIASGDSAGTSARAPHDPSEPVTITEYIVIDPEKYQRGTSPEDYLPAGPPSGDGSAPPRYVAPPTTHRVVIDFDPGRYITDTPARPDNSSEFDTDRYAQPSEEDRRRRYADAITEHDGPGALRRTSTDDIPEQFADTLAGFDPTRYLSIALGGHTQQPERRAGERDWSPRPETTGPSLLDDGLPAIDPNAGTDPFRDEEGLMSLGMSAVSVRKLYAQVEKENENPGSTIIPQSNIESNADLPDFDPGKYLNAQSGSAVTPSDRRAAAALGDVIAPMDDFAAPESPALTEENRELTQIFRELTLLRNG